MFWLLVLKYLACLFLAFVMIFQPGRWIAYWIWG